jgi:hypothetical protein
VLLPALQDCLPLDFANRVGLSKTHITNLSRDARGRFGANSVTVYPLHIRHLGDAMNRIIRASADTSLYRFYNSFFLSYAHGLKCPVESIADFENVFAADLNMEIVKESESVFVDFGCERFARDPTDTVLWKVSDPFVRMKHESIVKAFFTGSNIKQANYRFDKFLGFNSLAGCGYKSDQLVAGSRLGVHALKLYTTFKHPFYYRQSKADTSHGSNEISVRFTKGLNPFHIWDGGDKFDNFFVSNFIHALFHFLHCLNLFFFF